MKFEQSKFAQTHINYVVTELWANLPNLASVAKPVKYHEQVIGYEYEFILSSVP